MELLRARDWLQKAVEAQGAELIGAGVDGGAADLSIRVVIPKCAAKYFEITIKPSATQED
jgi:hypothetical protein